MNTFQKSYAQCGEDIIILFLIQHVLQLNSAYYLDLGANDPTRLNNTLLLYEHGYRGVSIDANPFFKKQFHELRPDDVFVCCGVGTKNGKEVFYEIDPHTLSTFSKKEADRYTKNGTHSLISQKKSPIYSVETIINKFCLKDPNILSLDVEGMDLEILRSINFEKWRPAVICVETLTYTEDASEEKVQEITDFLLDESYRVYADTYINTIFVDNNIWEQRR